MLSFDPHRLASDVRYRRAPDIVYGSRRLIGNTSASCCSPSAVAMGAMTRSVRVSEPVAQSSEFAIRSIVEAHSSGSMAQS